MNKQTSLFRVSSCWHTPILSLFCWLCAVTTLPGQPPSAVQTFPTTDTHPVDGSEATTFASGHVIPGFSKHGILSDAVRPIGSHINTTAAETGPFRYAERIYFCSDRDVKGCASGQGGLFSALQWETAKLFPVIPTEKSLFISHFSFTPDASELYFSVSGCKDMKQRRLGSEIYKARNGFESGWSVPELLPEPVNSPQGNSKEPALGSLWASNQEVLFFVAAWSEGKGKDDLWYCPREPDGNYGQPVPLPFNTVYNEQTPWFDNRIQTLYFSSDRPGGQGGYDIYRSSLLSDGTWTAPEPASVPVNSPYDDRWFFYHHASSTGYFSSNRPAAGKQVRNGFDPGDYDVYLVNAETTVELLFFSEADGQPQSNLVVRVTDLTQSSNITQLFRLSSHGIRLPVLLGHRYELEVVKEGFQELETMLEFHHPPISGPQRLHFQLRPHQWLGSK
ncbi:MAG: hypothetical protein RLY31_3086 [Bacteroidota bacterium]